MFIYIDIYVYIYICLYNTYLYTYRERESERDRDRERAHTSTPPTVCTKASFGMKPRIATIAVPPAPSPPAHIKEGTY